MKTASDAYLTELAEEALAGLTAISWQDFQNSSLRGETSWIDATSDEPGVEIEMSYRRLADAVEIEVVVYQPDVDGRPVRSVRRVGRVGAKS